MLDNSNFKLVSNHWSVCVWPSALAYYQISLFACLRSFALQIGIISLSSSHFYLHLSIILKVVFSHFVLGCPHKNPILPHTCNWKWAISVIQTMCFIFGPAWQCLLLSLIPFFYSLSLSLIIRPSFYLKPPTAIVFHRDVSSQHIWYTEKEQT